MSTTNLTRTKSPQAATRPLDPPTRLSRWLRRMNFAIVAYFRLRGLIFRPMPWRRRREQAAFHALSQHHPFASLVHYEQLAAPVRQELLPSYQHYTSQVSPDWMAVSFELATFLAALCRCLRPGRIIDLGTGYSSYVFRQYQQEARPAPEVCSVDDSPAWLTRTQQFLEEQGLSTANLMTWQEFVRSDPGRFDLALHDLGSLRVRRATLQKALDCAAPGGAVILDDANYPSCRRRAARLARARGLQPVSLAHATRDRYGRYAILLPIDAPASGGGAQ